MTAQVKSMAQGNEGNQMAKCGMALQGGSGNTGSLFASVCISQSAVMQVSQQLKITPEF